MLLPKFSTKRLLKLRHSIKSKVKITKVPKILDLSIQQMANPTFLLRRTKEALSLHHTPAIGMMSLVDMKDIWQGKMNKIKLQKMRMMKKKMITMTFRSLRIFSQSLSTVVSLGKIKLVTKNISKFSKLKPHRKTRIILHWIFLSIEEIAKYGNY